MMILCIEIVHLFAILICSKKSSSSDSKFTENSCKSRIFQTVFRNGNCFLITLMVRMKYIIDDAGHK